MWNLPNTLTLFRVLLVPVIMVFILSQTPLAPWIASAVFIIAGITDGLDGYYARRQKQSTVVGRLLDPLADKLLVSGSLITLTATGRISAWIATLIIGREFAVTALRVAAMAEGTVVSASSWGKAKTWAQIVAIVALILPTRDLFPYPVLGKALGEWMLLVFVIVMVLVTLYSGLDYFWRLRGILREKEDDSP